MSEKSQRRAIGEASSESVWAILRKPSVISVFFLVGLWNFSISSDWPSRHLQNEGFWRDTIGGIRDINLHLQLRFYQGLTGLRPMPFSTDHVSLAYVDDDVHWTTLYGDQPTSREFLARVITDASQTTSKAAVIGLDVELLSPRNFPAGSDASSRFADNQKLLAAIHFASSQGVPVILGNLYATTDDHHRFDLPNIFTGGDLLGSAGQDCAHSRCPGFGYLNLPDDKREIPIAIELPPVEPGGPAHLDSFAVALARAFRGPAEAAKDPMLAYDERHDTPTFGTFLAEANYPQISIADLANGERSAEEACANRIVLVGGRWHEGEGYFGWVDQHLSPAGYMSGLGLHANYVESLLQHRYAYEIPLWINIVLDLLVGLIIYLCFEAARKWWQASIVLLLVFFVPILAALLFLDIFNLYLDFLLPIELYFLHILYELIEKQVNLKRHRGHDERGAVLPVGTKSR
jgi:CHASE2 domain-containing sensor protein